MHVCYVDISYVPYNYKVNLIWQFVEFSSIAKLPMLFQEVIAEVQSLPN